LQHTLSTLRVEKDYYTTKQVAEIYHVTQVTVCNWLRKGWLQGEKKSDGKSSRWHIFPQQLEDEIEQHRDELIEQSKRYWMRLLVKMRK
jgi:transposase